MSISNSTPVIEHNKRTYRGPVASLASKQEIDPEFLRLHFTYDKNTGIFLKKSWVGSRGRVSKEVVYGVDGVNRYVQIPVGGLMFFAHRLAFVYVNGVYPELQVDHIDGDGRNNRWSNLRLVTHKENAQHNVNGNSNNTSGLRGAFRNRGKWKSCIGVDGVEVALGVFETKEQAHQAYISAKNRMHFQ